MRTILGVILLVVIIGAGWYIYDRQNKVIAFNDHIVDLMTQTNTYFDGYINHLDKYYEGKTIDIAQMKTELDKLGKNTDSVMTTAKQIAVPDHPECREFYSAFTKYLEYNSYIVTAYGAVMDYIESHNPGTENDFVEVGTILDPFISGDDALFQEIATTQEQMAKKFDFRLE